MNGTVSIYEILGGDRRSEKNDVLKSLFITGISGSTVEIEAEPYDDAYNFKNMDATIDKICRILDRREKTVFKKINNFFGTEVDTLSITFFDDFSVYGGATKILGEKAVTSG